MLNNPPAVPPGLPDNPGSGDEPEDKKHQESSTL